jgi:pyruvate dehydrogenase E2 component (dihydrolipoamide acetyltransferase)
VPSEVHLTKVGMTMTEGVVAEWYVADGARVEKGALLYRLETEKVELDVDADASGTLKQLVAANVTLAPGDRIGLIFAPGELIPANLPQTAARGARASEVADTLGLPAAAEGRDVKASPLARRLAQELGVDLAHLRGSGPGGRIVKEDVEAAAAAPRPRAAAAAVADERAGEKIPLRGMRKTIATRMHQSLQSSAQLTLDMDARMDECVRLREQLIAEWASEGVRPSVTDLVVRAVTKALAQHPRMNSVLHESEITLLSEIHVGIAVALEEGLVVPVIRNTPALDLKALAQETARLARAARDGKLGLDDFAGGTFTVTTLGRYGVDSFTPILNAPQSGILGVNRIRDDVGWDGDRPVKRRAMRLSLTWDHRVLDGEPAARFLASVRDLLEAPYRLLV